MSEISELDIVVLTRDQVEHGLVAGDVGTVVHRYGDGKTLEVEFVTGEGTTAAVLTLALENVRPMKRRDKRTHVGRKS